jgi:hypothetical protein
VNCGFSIYERTLNYYQHERTLELALTNRLGK